MSKSNVHLSYVSALLKATKELKCEREVSDEVKAFSEVFNSSEGESLAFVVASLPASERRAFLEKSFSHKCNKVTLNLVIHLFSKGRIALLPLIAELFAAKICELNGIAKLSIRTAIGLTPKGEEQIIAMLKKKHSGEMSVEFSVDESLIGGVQIYEKGSVMDYSVKNYLSVLKKTLLDSELN